MSKKEVKPTKVATKEVTEYELLVDKISTKLANDGEKITKAAIKKVISSLPESVGEVLTERGEI